LLLVLLRLLELPLVLLMMLCLLGWRVLESNSCPTGSALRPAALTAPLATPADVAAAVTAGNAAYLLERTASSTSRSGQHHLSPKKKKKTHSLDCPKNTVHSLEGTLELMNSTLCLIWIIVTVEHRRPKSKKPLQKHCAVLRCCHCNWSLLSYHWWYLWLNWCCLRGHWWLLLCCHLCKLLTSCRHLLVLPRGLEHHPPPLLQNLWRGRQWKAFLLLCSLLQQITLRQQNTWLVELLRLSIHRHVLGCNRLVWCGILMLHQLSNLSASTPDARTPIPTKDLTIGTAAHGPGDPEGLTDQSKKICNEGPLGAYPKGEVNKYWGTLLMEDAVYYSPVFSARREGCCCEVSREKEGMSFTKKLSRDYQSPTDSNSRIDINMHN
ncbi:hypothetical protein Taro_007543, partial [Colocasia esculenta]|nr:hypothetical protein [Colocasia esculenta]